MADSMQMRVVHIPYFGRILRNFQQFGEKFGSRNVCIFLLFFEAVANLWDKVPINEVFDEELVFLVIWI